MAPQPPPIAHKDMRALLDCVADLMFPTTKLWEDITLPIGAQTRAHISIKGPISPEAIDRLCAALSQMRDFATGPAPLTSADLSSAFDAAVDRLAKEREAA